MGLLLLISHSYADDLCALKSGGHIDRVMGEFGSLASTWQSEISPIAKKIFFILFGMEFMWQLTVKKVFAGDVEKLWVFFFTRTVLCFFFAKYLINVELYTGVINYFIGLGSRLGGFSFSIDNGGARFDKLSPSAIVSTFSCISQAIHKISDDTPAYKYITVKFSLAIIQVMLFVVLMLIVIGVIRAIIQAYFLLYAGFILAGFAGSSWTIDYWQRYLRTVSGVAIRFLAVCFMMGVLYQDMGNWADAINAASGIDDLAAVVMHVFGMSFLYAFFMIAIPEWASRNLAGEINMRLQTAVSGGRSMGGSHSNPVGRALGVGSVGARGLKAGALASNASSGMRVSSTPAGASVASKKPERHATSSNSRATSNSVATGRRASSSAGGLPPQNGRAGNFASFVAKSKIRK